uniref:Uncharacterized protein n=1 Tax=Mycena chlorophos TaxID=658473 RepID=A0ABQ0LWG1_MYCCL|nr:predicted protein [Mycena chlorophos]
MRRAVTVVGCSSLSRPPTSLLVAPIAGSSLDLTLVPSVPGSPFRHGASSGLSPTLVPVPAPAVAASQHANPTQPRPFLPPNDRCPTSVWSLSDRCRRPSLTRPAPPPFPLSQSPSPS